MAADIPLETVNAVIGDTAGIDEHLAGALAAEFGVEKQFWLNYQAGYDADIERGVVSVLTGRGTYRPDELAVP